MISKGDSEPLTIEKTTFEYRTDCSHSSNALFRVFRVHLRFFVVSLPIYGLCIQYSICLKMEHTRQMLLLFSTILPEPRWLFGAFLTAKVGSQDLICTVFEALWSLDFSFAQLICRFAPSWSWNLWDSEKFTSTIVSCSWSKNMSSAQCNMWILELPVKRMLRAAFWGKEVIMRFSCSIWEFDVWICLVWWLYIHVLFVCLLHLALPFLLQMLLLPQYPLFLAPVAVGCWELGFFVVLLHSGSCKELIAADRRNQRQPESQKRWKQKPGRQEPRSL